MATDESSPCVRRRKVARGRGRGLNPNAADIDKPTLEFRCDPKSTKIFVTNLNPEVTEETLIDVFGKYGPLASIEILRFETTCAYIIFMVRGDAEEALCELDGEEVMSHKMNLCWGAACQIPKYPICTRPSDHEDVKLYSAMSQELCNTNSTYEKLAYSLGMLRMQEENLSLDRVRVYEAVGRMKQVLCEAQSISTEFLKNSEHLSKDKIEKIRKLQGLIKKLLTPRS